MDVQTITEMWKPHSGNVKAGVEWWNGKADHFSTMELPTEENSLGIRIIRREGMIGKDSKVLDVGCGCGRFSFAVEACGAEATATDFSPKMIEIARETGASRGSKASFSVDDWRSVDLKEKGWEHKFDLVLANMTPAIISADTFLKLLEASRNWVLMVKPTRRTNLVLDELNRLVGVERDAYALDETIAYAFDLAWLNGGCPRLEYEEQVWESDMPLEEAVTEYTLRISSSHELTEEDEAKIREHLTCTAIDGIVHETTHTTIAAMYWQVVTA